MENVLVARRAFAGVADEVPVARLWFTELLGSDHPAVDIARLLLTEAATNVVIHAGSGFTVEFCSTDDAAHLAVSGQGTDTAPEVQHPEDTDEGGRGMLLVDELADYWGSERTPTGRTTWFGVSA